MSKGKAIPPSPREMELDDCLTDVLTGFCFWREHKIASMELTDLDEMFIRWMEHGRPRPA